LFYIIFFIELNFSIVKKRKLVHSAKKIYTSVIPMEEPTTKDIYRFPVYRDCDIGINEYWQAPLIESVRIKI